MGFRQLWKLKHLDFSTKTTVTPVLPQQGLLSQHAPIHTAHSDAPGTDTAKEIILLQKGIEWTS